MWRHYLTVGFRAMLRSKFNTAVNILGLATGLAACIVILLFVQHERSYETWLPESDRVAQLQTTMIDPNDGRIISAQAARPAAAALQEEFPEVEQSVALTSSRVLLRAANDWTFSDIHFVDPGFFEVLQFPLIRGNPTTALADVGNVVLTESEAVRLLGSADVMGRSLTINSRGQKTDLKITGILRDLPPTTHFRFGILTRFDSGILGAHESEFRSWSRLSGYVYARLRSPQSVQAVNAALPRLIERRVAKHERPYPAVLTLVPIRDIHLGGAREDSMKPSGDALAVSAFVAIAVLILLVGCMNFANLVTAQSSLRAREVALRKVVGASRGQLSFQFLGEAMAVTLVAMFVALALAELVAPAFGALMQAPLQVRYTGEGGLLAPAILLWIVVGLACGIYPAMLLSRFRPGQILRSGRPDAMGAARLRNLLVIGQFAISIGLIICTAIVFAQTNYARSVDPGFRQSGLLVVNNMPRLYSKDLQQSYIEQLRRIEGVEAIGRSTVAPGNDRQAALPFTVPGRSEPALLNLNFVDWGFQEALGVALIAGRFFDESRPADDATVNFDPTDEDGPALAARGANIVLSESSLDRIGADSPAEAIGKRLFAPVRGISAPVPATVVGVVGDAQLRSVRDRIRPAVYMINQDRYTHLLLRFAGADPRAVRSAAETAWKRTLPTVPFEAGYAEDVIAEFYEADRARGRVFALFAILAIILSCLGLFALAALATERRTKEIGIRKVFGARTRDIVALLAWQFSRLVIVANVISWPVAWWLMRDWLNSFAYRVPLHPGWFIGAGLAALAIALATVAGHAIRVARLNPVHALRYE